MIRKKSTPREVDFWYCDLRLESSAGNFIVWIDFFCGIVDLVVGNAGSHFRGVAHSFWNFGDVVEHTRSSARYTEGFNFKRLNWYFFWGVELWYIVVWVTICTIYELTWLSLVNGAMYSQTTSFSGVTSKILEQQPSVIMVLPLGRR